MEAVDQKVGRWAPRAVTVLTGGEMDDDSTISVRYNGRLFHVHMSPKNFQNSPKATSLYLRNLQVFNPDGPGEFEDILDEDVYEWVIELFLPIFTRLAPDMLAPFDPDKIRSGTVQPLLSDYLFPQTFGCRLDAVDEVLIPRQIDKPGMMVPKTWLDGSVLDDCETWTYFFEPSEIEVSFTDPEQSLYSMPTRVHIDLHGRRQTCFFKSFEMGITGGPLHRELNTYKKIQTSGLDKKVNIGSLVALAHYSEDDGVMGLLLRYIDSSGTLQEAIEDEPELEIRSKWAAQIGEAVKELHALDCVWGDVKPQNILIDQNNDAYITDFEGGYTRGWADEDKAGTVEGDIQGLQRVVDFIFGRISVRGVMQP